MNETRVVLGALFTIVGVVTLLVPSIPFLCIGALIFGPIMVVVGLLEGPPRVRRPARFVRQPRDAFRPLPNACGACGINNDPASSFCVYCGAPLS